MRKDAAENRKAIVEVATELFAQLGPDVSLRTIAKEAEVGVATASRHFTDRDDLYRAVRENALSKMQAVVDEHVPRFPSDPEATWRSAINALVDIRLPAVGQAILPVLASHSNQEEWDGLTEKVETLYRPLLAEAARYGLCPHDLDVVDFHFGIIAISRPLPAPAEETFGNRRKWLLNVFIDGLRASASLA